MKKSIFKVVFSAFAAVLIFTSCLGEEGTTIEREGSFAYISLDQATGVKYAAVEGLYITSPLIRELMTEGQCYLISFRASLNDDDMYSNTKFYSAEDTDQPVAIPSTPGMVGPVTMANQINPVAFSLGGPGFAYADDFLGNRWGFKYIVNVKENDDSRAHFFYDPAAQYEMVDGVREDLEKNQIIIDVRFSYEAGPDSGTTLNKEIKSVSDFSNIKRAYLSSPNFQWDEEQGDVRYARVSIKFRYSQLQSDGIAKEVLAGQWDTATAPYMFVYYEQTNSY